jgi:hypothetical protein
VKSPIVRIVLHNAFILSLVYLVTGIAVDLAWRFDVFRGHLKAEHAVFRLSLGIDALPARVLDAVGLLGGLQQAYADGRIHEMGLRWIFAATTIAIIVATAFLVAALMALAGKLFDGKRRRRV